MAFLSIPHVAIKGIATCVPPIIDENADFLLSADDLSRLIGIIGVERKHIADEGTCTSDLCCRAAETLIAELGWSKEEISHLIFVSQTPDYITPATACILQNRLGLSTECYAVDINMGCSG